MIRALALIFALLASLVGMGGCATRLVQSPLMPTAEFAGPRLEKDAFVSFDGARLPMTTWEAKGEPWAVIIGLHGMNDYSNGFHLAAPVWAEDGVTTLAYDQRGFGKSISRGIWPGTDLLKQDIKTIVPLVRARYPHAIIAVVGISMGGGSAITAFGDEDAPQADRLVLLSPAVWGWSSQPLAYKTALWTVGHVTPGLTLSPPKGIARLTIQTSDNTPELIAMGRDKNMLWGARTDVLYGIVGMMQTAWESTGRIKVPTAYLYGYRDQVIPHNAAFHAAAQLKPTDKTAYYLDGYHLLLVDKQRERVIRDVEGFLRDPAKPLVSGAAPIPKSGR